jgi:hypothetical protein
MAYRFFQLLAKSLTAKSWGEELQSDGVVNARKAAEGGKSEWMFGRIENTPGAHRDAGGKRQS